ncbi:MAG: efflux RND transporter periplasmic adaptor subunit [Burkholderiales bacterium]|nr:efflux RND transporter periplasmic adaptor subunit [Burkholderiales bacterium]
MEDKRKLIGPVLLGIAAVVIGAGFFYYLAQSRKMPEGLIVASGRIEGERIVAAAKYPGRISKVLVKEGDTVTADTVVAQLEDSTFLSRVDQAKQALNATEAQLKAAQESLEVVSKEVPMGISVADATVSQAQAMLAKANAVEQQAQRDAQRHKELFERGVIEKHRYEQADLAWQVAQSDVKAAQESVKRARQGFLQAGLGSDKVHAKQQEIEALKAQRDRAAAAVSEAGSVLSDLTIKAPATGVVLTRLREPGEVIMPGGSVIEMVNLDHLHLKVYVPESKIGQLRLGLPVRIYTDAQPDQFYTAKVSFIASRAEFTPKEVQTTDERVKLVYAVKLAIDKNPEHRLTPGIPADAVIRWKEDVAWQKPSWK